MAQRPGLPARLPEDIRPAVDSLADIVARVTGQTLPKLKPMGRVPDQIVTSIELTTDERRVYDEAIADLAESWQERTLASSGFWTEMACDGTYFVAFSGASSNKIQRSIDGRNWSEVTLPTARTWGGVAAKSGRFVAVAGAHGGTASNVACRSTDNGVTWTESATLPASANWNCIGYSPTQDKFCTIDNSNRSATSADGITWTSGTMPHSRTWSAVEWCAELNLWVAVANNGGTPFCIATSSDGLSWTNPTDGTPDPDTDGVAFPFIDVAWNGGIAVAIANGSTTYYTSSNLSNWTARTGGMPDADVYAIVAAGETFWIVCNSDSKAFRSTDGLAWSEYQLPSSSTWQSVAANSEGLISTVASNTTKAASIGLTKAERDAFATVIRVSSSFDRKLQIIASKVDEIIKRLQED